MSEHTTEAPATRAAANWLSDKHCPQCHETGFAEFDATPLTDRPEAKLDATCENCNQEYSFYVYNRAEPEPVTDRSDWKLTRVQDRALTWQEIFGHPTAYEHQQDAIPSIIENGKNDGYSVVEGDCGTGKTSIGLTAGATLIKDPSTKYEQILIVTSVKQQLKQFEEDAKIINEHLPPGEPQLRTLSLVGKTDLCAYVQGTETTHGLTADNINSRCSQLRSNTKSIGNNNNQKLAQKARSKQSTWEAHGVESPYGPELPELSGRDYCPFYAESQGREDAIRFTDGDNSVLDATQLVQNGVAEGVCPHTEASSLLQTADIVIANYYHLFDRNTLQMTHDIVANDTFLICDESHMLGKRVRQIMTEYLPLTDFSRGLDELATVYKAYNKDIDTQRPFTNDITSPPSSIASTSLQSTDLPIETQIKALYVLEKVYSYIINTVKNYLTTTYPDWENDIETVPNRLEIALRDPEEVKTDRLTNWVESNGIPESLWTRLPGITSAVTEALENAQSNAQSDSTISPRVADFCLTWFTDTLQNRTDYFRKIVLERRDRPSQRTTGWRRYYDAHLVLENVFARSSIYNKLTEMGGGLLMSATLEPLDAYKQTTGVSLASKKDNRPVNTDTYANTYPQKNRYSAILSLDPFTYRNRGNTESLTDTRIEYAEALIKVVNAVEGSTMIAMPSYAEAEWVGQLIMEHDSLSVSVFIDQSSSEEQTKELKQAFFDETNAVLTTATRGTLTEGVDYTGDRLHNIIVCGVPIDEVGSQGAKAIQTAYEDAFANGFGLAFKVPAVRKARQALGRVIRSPKDVGTRILIDERYQSTGYSGVQKYLSEQEQNEYETVPDIDKLIQDINRFWESKGKLINE